MVNFPAKPDKVVELIQHISNNKVAELIHLIFNDKETRDIIKTIYFHDIFLFTYDVWQLTAIRSNFLTKDIT